MLHVLVSWAHRGLHLRAVRSAEGTETTPRTNQEPVRLRPTEDFGIEPGAVLTLADEVSLTYEVSE